MESGSMEDDSTNDYVPTEVSEAEETQLLRARWNNLDTHLVLPGTESLHR